MEPHASAAGSALSEQSAGERLVLDRLLSLYNLREPSLSADQLQLFTQQMLLRTLSRSLSLTLPWEVDKLSGALQLQHASINQGVRSEGAAGGAGSVRPTGPLPGASWHDIQQLRLEACLETREQELAAAADSMPESARLAALIESKKLRLVGLQRELRQEILLEQRLVEECSQPTQLLDWTRWRRLPPNRFATFLPPRLPAVEVARRLQRDPETARRARQQALQQWVAQQAQQQQPQQRAARGATPDVGPKPGERSRGTSLDVEDGQPAQKQRPGSSSMTGDQQLLQQSEQEPIPGASAGPSSRATTAEPRGSAEPEQQQLGQQQSRRLRSRSPAVAQPPPTVSGSRKRSRGTPDPSKEGEEEQEVGQRKRSAKGSGSMEREGSQRPESDVQMEAAGAAAGARPSASELQSGAGVDAPSSGGTEAGGAKEPSE